MEKKEAASFVMFFSSLGGLNQLCSTGVCCEVNDVFSFDAPTLGMELNGHYHSNSRIKVEKLILVYWLHMYLYLHYISCTLMYLLMDISGPLIHHMQTNEYFDLLKRRETE